MNELGFKQWVEARFGIGRGPANDARARCKRVENAGMDLDQGYAEDHLEGILTALKYTIEDVHNGTLPPEGLTFRFTPESPNYFGRIKDVLSGLHNAVKLYRMFRDGADPQDVMIESE